MSRDYRHGAYARPDVSRPKRRESRRFNKHLPASDTERRLTKDDLDLPEDDYPDFDDSDYDWKP